MKSKEKILDLMKRGLSRKTISKLTEQDIETLYSKLLIEQVTEIPAKKTYKVGPKGGKVGSVVISPDPNTKEVMVTAEQGEMKEDIEDSMNFEKGQRTQDPHQVGPSTDDGFGNYGDGTGEVGEGKKNKKYNRWAICTSQLSDEFGTSERSEWSKTQMNKYERCVKDVKKSLKEGKNPVSLFLEQQITKIVMKHLPPRMTKGDLIKMINESPAAPAVKPATKPTTKPTTKPSSPGKNPFPKEHPGPKANTPSPEEAKEKVINLIMNLIKNNEK